MRRSTLRGILAAVVIALGATALARGFPQYSRDTQAACAACHVSMAGGPELSDMGKAFKANRKTKVAATSAGAEYVGNDRCRLCHLPQHTAWSTTPHARALEVLATAPDSTVAKFAKRLKVKVDGKPAESEACVVCHVTGWKLPGGYPSADSLRHAALGNVTCESCHGPGSRHVRAALADKKKTINGAPSVNMCLQCHVPALSPGFNYDERKKKVHPVPVKTSE